MSPVSVFEAVIRENRSALLGYFQRRIPNAEDAAEAFGELLLTAWRIRRRMPKDPLAAAAPQGDVNNFPMMVLQHRDISRADSPF